MGKASKWLELLDSPQVIRFTHHGLIALGALLFIPFLGAVHLFDWDELNFAEAAREMIVTGDFLNVQINFVPFYEKPPLFFWLQALSMKIFGVNEFAARFPNAVIGIAAMNFMYSAGKAARDHRMGLLWVFAYLGSILPFFYFKSGIIDPLYNLLITAGIWQYVRYQQNRDSNRGLYAGLLIGTAILAKGPVALLIWGLVVLVDLSIRRFRNFPDVRFIFYFALTFLISGGSWFIVQIIRGDMNVVLEFVRVQIALFSTDVAGHAQPWYYHPVVLLFGCFPISIFAIRYLFKKHQMGSANYYMAIMFWVILVLFSIVKTKIVHYSSLTYYPLAFLAAAFLWRYFRGETQLNRIQWGLGILVFVIMNAVFIALPLIGQYLPEIAKQIKADEYTIGMMSTAPTWMGWEWIIGAIFGLGVVAIAIRAKRYRAALVLIFGHIAISIFLIMTFYLPHIEPVTQGGAISFYKQMQEEDAYLTTLSMKSYGYLFYSDARPHENPRYGDRHWLLTGNIDKPAYFVLRANQRDRYLMNPELELVDQRGGYVLLRRMPNGD